MADSEKEPFHSGKENAEGWQFVEERMDKYDRGVMKDYSDDIDNALILDGLLSAVITAFLIPANMLLQQDISRASFDVLTQMSAQLSSLTVAPQFINSTTPAFNATESQSFQPAVSSRWINSLWFLSLILTLTSAVLGILAKQWIREYLRWNSATAQSRENVLVRQIRFEAWDKWHTSALISAVPVLLELAIILFVCGLTVFVWTLDIVVAIVATISVALLLLLITILTLLPTIFKRCPYRSPTAWAFIYLWNQATMAATHIRQAYTQRIRSCPESSSAGQEIQDDSAIFDFDYDFSGNIVDYFLPATLPSWRVSDLQDMCIRKLPGSGEKTTDATLFLADDLCAELGITVSSGSPSYLEFPEADNTPAFRLSPNVAGQVYFPALTEFRVLSRGLAWTFADLQASNIRHLFLCARTIHTPGAVTPYEYNILPDLLLAHAFRNLILWDSISDATFLHMFGWQIAAPLVGMSTRSATPTLGARAILAYIRHELDPSMDIPGGVPILQTIPDGFFVTDKQVASVMVLKCCLAFAIESYSAALLNGHLLQLPPTAVMVRRHVQRLNELLHAFDIFVASPHWGHPIWSSIVAECSKAMANAFNAVISSQHKDQFDTRFPKARSKLLGFIANCSGNTISTTPRWQNGVICLESTNNSTRDVRIEKAVNYPLVIGYPLDSSPATTREDFHAIGDAITRALRYEAKLLSGEDWRRLLQKAEKVLDRTAERSWRDGGRYDDGYILQWPFCLTKPWDMAGDAQSSQGSALCIFIHQKAPDALLHFLRTCERHEHLIDRSDELLEEISDLLGYSANGERVFPYPDSVASPSASTSTSSESVQLALSEGGERDEAYVGVEISAHTTEYFLWNIDDWGLVGGGEDASGSQVNAFRVSGDDLMSEALRELADIDDKVDDENGGSASKIDGEGASNANDHDATNNDGRPGLNSTSPVDAEGPPGDSAPASGET